MTEKTLSSKAGPSRTVVVTGAAQGIGRAIAERLGQEGWGVALVDRNEAALSRSTEELAASGVNCRAVLADVSSEAGVARAMDEIDAAFGRLDALVNNAGGAPASGRASLVADMPLAEWRDVLAVNLTGTFLMCRAALPIMRRNRWGRIVNMSSQGGRMRSLLSGAHYGAAKAGLIGFSRVLAGEVGPEGITVNCVAPGRIETAQSDAFGGLENYLAQLPVRRLGTPQEIAAAVSYLLSDDAAFVTGAILDVNGGHFMP